MTAAPIDRRRDVIRRLLAERGIDRFALFLTQEEGTVLGGGLEAISGFVLDEHGTVHGFWLDWDPHRRRYALDPWYRLYDLTDLADDAEYRRARRELGLDG